MKNKALLRSLLCLALLLAVMAAGVLGVNALTAPIVEANKKAALGDAVLIYDRDDPDSSRLTVDADSVRSVYQDDTKQVYTLHLSTNQGYTKDVPIELTMVVDYEGKIVSVAVDSSGETKELSEDFLPGFTGQDATLAGVELVAGVTFSSSAIKNAVNDGFETLVANGLLAEAQKSDEQLLKELVPLAYPGIVNKAGAIQGEELEAYGSATGGAAAANGSGCFWYVDAGEKLLAVYTHVGGVTLYNTLGEVVTDSADPALLEEIETISVACLGEGETEIPAALAKLLPEGAEPVPVKIPGLTGCVTGAWSAETEDGMLYAFSARPYGYANEVMELFYVLDESGAIRGIRAAELILHAEYFSNYSLDEQAYKDGFLGLTADSYTGDQALISGATMSSEAVDTATDDVFEAFALLTDDRG
ncbi:MAG: FMN-binding protein [Firmicutes bacterium]|nr:FMN-binding protein [Bacillota bacterium]